MRKEINILYLKKTGSFKRIGQSAEVELAKTSCRQKIEDKHIRCPRTFNRKTG